MLPRRSKRLRISGVDAGAVEQLTLPLNESLVSTNRILRMQILRLPLEDLKNCRLVCKTWEADATPMMLQRSCLKFKVMSDPDPENLNGGFQYCERFARRQTPAESKKIHLDHWRRNHGFLSYGRKIPSNIQNLTIQIDKYYPDAERFSLQICKLYCKTLVELDYTLPISFRFPTEIKVFQFLLPRLRSLKKLRLTVLLECVEDPLPFFPATPTSVKELSLRFGNRCCEDCHGYGREVEEYQHVRDVAQNFHQTFPVLEALTLEYSHNCLPDRFLEAILEDPIRAQLTSLRTVKVENALTFDSESLFKMNFPNTLTSLSVRFFDISLRWPNYETIVKGYEQLIWSHAPTLTHLQLWTDSVTEKGQFDLVLPRMPKLKCLEHFYRQIYAPKFVPKDLCFNVTFCMGSSRTDTTKILDYSKQFPLVETLKLTLDCDEEYSDMRPALQLFLPRNQRPPIRCNSLRTLEIRCKKIMPKAAQHLKIIERDFPNAHISLLNEINIFKCQ